MKLGIFGGTFDPPHLGHIHAGRTAIAHLNLDQLLVIPTGNPPYKSLPEGSPTARQRLEMTQIAFSEFPNAHVLDYEAASEDSKYSWETLQYLHAAHPNDELYLIMGEDTFSTLPGWVNANQVLKLVIPAVVLRDNQGRENALRVSEEILRRFGVRSIMLFYEAFTVSSTEIRRQLAERQGTVFLKRQVYDYILKNRLYHVRPNFDHLRFAAYQMLDPKRTRHVAGCEQEAVRLALRWGEDPDLAREAAILHDITKRCDAREQLNLCSEYDIIIDDIEKSEYKLLHSKTGAAVSKDRFAVSDKVFDAIACHTTGKENMSLLDKIIYIADYIEPNRDFDGLFELRSLAYVDLDAAVILGITMSIDDMNRRGIIPHPNSVAARAYLQTEHQSNGTTFQSYS